jgi:FKBP-type peptidyl-prolyl cis-trans isomerase
MRKFSIVLTVLFLFPFFSLNAQRAIVTDSLYAIGYLITIQPGYGPNVKYWDGGILGGPAKLSIQKDKKKSSIDLNFFGKAEVLATGEGTKVSKQKISFPLDIAPGSDYQLMLQTAADSLGNFTLYSGYAYLPELKKWKLIGTIKVAQYARYLHPVSTMESYVKNQAGTAVFKENWVMERNGRWKDLNGKNAKQPDINLAHHVDSAARVTVDAGIIQKRAATDMKALTAGPEGLYYTILEKGTGKPVQVTDTVKLFYKGFLLENGEVFDQTKDKNPARFPLSRLIRGWQLGVPFVNEGGKIQLVIPSHLAYGIRTRSPKIPPNSILVFDIEVLDTTPAQ